MCCNLSDQMCLSLRHFVRKASGSCERPKCSHFVRQFPAWGSSRKQANGANVASRYLNVFVTDSVIVRMEAGVEGTGPVLVAHSLPLCLSVGRSAGR